MTSPNGTGAHWIAADWGTSNLRVWGMSASGQPIASAHSAEGMGNLKPDEFEAALMRLVEPWLGDGVMPAIACGMVGAKQGWIDAGYVSVPGKPALNRLVAAPVQNSKLRVFIIPGMSQASPADVMRGEETQIAGYMHLHPDWDGVICLPGTHTKWVHISAGEIVSFQTAMTGEMFDLLAESSVLRHSVDGAGWDDAAFLGALDDTISRPERLASLLFSIRAGDILQGQEKIAARSRLSGLLIGAELAATRPYWLGQEIAIIGVAPLCDYYGRALAHQGATATVAGSEDMTLSGLQAAFSQLEHTL